MSTGVADLSWENDKCELDLLESNNHKFLYASNFISDLSPPEIKVLFGSGETYHLKGLIGGPKWLQSL